MLFRSLNACGWAINRPMRFSMKRARAFTICAPCRICRVICLLFAIFVVVALAFYFACPCTKKCAPAADGAPAAAPAAEEAPASASAN